MKYGASALRFASFILVVAGALVVPGSPSRALDGLSLTSTPKSMPIPRDPGRTAAMSCCQCVSTSTNPPTPSACVANVTDANACSTTCSPGLGGVMEGTCADGVHCK